MTKASLTRAEHAEHEARLALGQSLVSEGAALQRTGLIGQRFDSLDRLGKAAQVLGADPEGRKRLPEIRNHAIAALGLTDLRVRWQHDYGLPRHQRRCRSGAVRGGRAVRRGRRAPDGRRPRAGPPAGTRPARLLVCAVLISARTASCWWRRTIGGGGARPDCGSGTWNAGSCSAASRAVEAWHSTPMAAVCCSVRRRGESPSGTCVERRVVRRLPLEFTPNHLALDPEGRRLAVNNADYDRRRGS